MSESGILMEHLRNEYLKLRRQNAHLQKDFGSLQENNQRLIDANNSLNSTFDALNHHAKQLSKTNGKLKTEVKKTNAKLEAQANEHECQIEALQMMHTELKEELQMKQCSYIAEVHSRLQYQKLMMGIVDTVQERCRDHRLVEDILAMSDELEVLIDGTAGGGGWSSSIFT